MFRITKLRETLKIVVIGDEFQALGKKLMLLLFYHYLFKLLSNFLLLNIQHNLFFRKNQLVSILTLTAICLLIKFIIEQLIIKVDYTTEQERGKFDFFT